VKQRLISLVPGLILVIAAARLVPLVSAEWQRISGAEIIATSVKRRGSPRAVSSNGFLDGYKTAHQFRLMFVLRKAHLSTDVNYWNDVRETLGARGNAIDWWGVCDSGDACNHVESSAKFSIVGYMDPSQMRSLALAFAGENVVLYEWDAVRRTIRGGAKSAEMAVEIAQTLEQPDGGK
jgi:hypothetical protein